MTVKKRGLGRGLNDLGLDQLLSSVEQPVSTTPSTNKKSGGDEFRRMPVEFLQPGKYQPRKDMDTEPLQELADSIRSQGVIQPIVVRPISNEKYEIIAGERRWRASQLAGLPEVPVIVRELSDESAIAMALIENIQRENLNSIEEAEAVQRLINEFQMTHDEVSKVVGKSRSTISNLLRLLSLHPSVKTMVERGDLEMGHARAMLSLDEKQQTQAAKVVVEKGMSVRDTETYVRKMQNPPEKPEKAESDPDLLRLQNMLADKLGAPVAINHSPGGRGKLIIKYNNLDEFDGILSHLLPEGVDS